MESFAGEDFSVLSIAVNQTVRHFNLNLLTYYTYLLS